jgi:hypothetical protein
LSPHRTSIVHGVGKLVFPVEWLMPVVRHPGIETLNLISTVGHGEAILHCENVGRSRIERFRYRVLRFGPAARLMIQSAYVLFWRWRSSCFSVPMLKIPSLLFTPNQTCHLIQSSRNLRRRGSVRGMLALIVLVCLPSLPSYHLCSLR